MLYPVQVLPSCKKRLRWCQGQFIAVGQLNTIGKVIMKTSVTLTFDSVEDMVAHFAATAAPNVTATSTPQPAPPMPQAPGPAVASSDVDKNGLPWDERIHSPSKAINQDGSWRGKKGVSAEEKERVTAELTGKPQIQTNPEDRQDPAAPVTPPMPQAQPAPTPPQAAAPMPVVDQAPTPQPVAQPAAANPQQSFQNFMQTLAPQMQSGVVDTNHLAVLTNEIATAFNVQLSAITDIANNQQMIDYAIGCLTRDGKWV